ncbi:MAG: TauD/TfdA family dioxygenase [Gammaproteobacteria bacterium]|nr:TauD/TfdA family dioxygenase [Gammaproteobacteria bacterium]
MPRSLRIEPADATLGATVTGVRLAALTPAEWGCIEDAFHAHAVLIFPGQHLSGEDQAALARRFGELSIEGQLFTNETADGSVRPPDDPVMLLLRGSEGWHTDSSFQHVSAKVSMLSARKVVSHGGETGWADMRAAYDALDAETRDRIAGLAAYHSLFHSQARVGQGGASMVNGLAELRGDARNAEDPAPVGEGSSGYAPGALDDRDPPLRPLLKVHPVTGRPALFVGRHAYGIPGLAEEASEQLLDELIDFACRPPRVLEHRWEVGDLAIWDNRCVLHRARPWDFSEPRMMFHTRVGGDPATETAL